MEAAGRTAVVTGASRGLGAGIARELHRRGLQLALCARTTPALAAGERVLAERLDVTDAAAVERFAERASARFGGVDLWINNAGVLEPIGPLRELEATAFRRHLEVNVLGVFHGTRAFVRLLRTHGTSGVLVNVSSGAGRNAYAGWSAYCAAKAAVDRLTECIQLEEGARGLRAYALAPGVIDTDMQEQIRACTPERFPAVERFRERARTGRFNTPEFVAREILALAFDPTRGPEDVLVRLAEERP